ncbi:MAG: inositol monophosphatase, partial [Mesorhizobium sp.]
MSKLPDSSFLHHLADLADAETLPRYLVDLAVETKVKAGYRFDPVTEADREAEIALRAAIVKEFPD